MYTNKYQITNYKKLTYFKLNLSKISDLEKVTVPGISRAPSGSMLEYSRTLSTATAWLSNSADVPTPIAKILLKCTAEDNANPTEELSVTRRIFYFYMLTCYLFIPLNK